MKYMIHCNQIKFKFGDKTQIQYISNNEVAKTQETSLSRNPVTNKDELTINIECMLEVDKPEEPNYESILTTIKELVNKS